MHPLATALDDPTHVDSTWADVIPFEMPSESKRKLGRIVRLIEDPSWAVRFRHQLTQSLKSMPEPDRLATKLFRFLRASSDPAQTLTLFDQDENSLESLFKLFLVSDSLSRRLVANPSIFLSFGWVLRIPGHRNGS